MEGLDIGSDHREELRAIARNALAEFDRVPPRAPQPA